MNRLLVLLTTILLLSYTNAQATDKTYGDFHAVHVVRNYDGDTITVNIDDVPDILGKEISIRVYGIDTPEIHGKCDKERHLAIEAKELVYVTLRDTKYLSLLNTRRGKYFRIVADVITSEGNLAEILLDKGLAVKYNGGTKVKDWCE